jgi:hypothetical protein
VLLCNEVFATCSLVSPLPFWVMVTGVGSVYYFVIGGK